MRGNLYTVVYAGVFGCVCALLLTGVRGWTQARRDVNEQAERERHILAVLGADIAADTSPQTIHQLFLDGVKPCEAGEVMLYAYTGPDATGPEAFAVGVEGVGLWGPVEGFLALEPDVRTVRAVTFHKHEETPGLGGRIEEPEFRGQFRGKSIVDAAGKPGIRVVAPGSSSAPNEVDAITGATITSQRIEHMLNETIARVWDIRDRVPGAVTGDEH